jgi:hypothetical protein
VLALAALWVLRLVAGAAIVQVLLSTWLLSFGAFLFLSLGLVKRCSELRASPLAPDVAVPGRAYRGVDLPALQVWGISTGAAAVVVLALFVDSTSALARYTHPERLWLVCACVWFWLGRVWLLTGRGDMHHDPIAFALRDPASWATFAVVVLAWTAALLPY